MKRNKRSKMLSPTLTLSIQPINAAESLRDKAYATLKQAITDADIYNFSEEIQLDKHVLSEALGVSRTPVREAMAQLEQEGFLRILPRKGYYIVRKTKKEIVEMIWAWAALESMSARLVALNASDEEIAGLRHIFDRFKEEAPAGNLDEYSNANIAFHQEIVRIGGSQLIANLIKNIFIHVRAIRKMTIVQSHRAERSMADHIKIIEALERRDAELAEQLVRQHSLDLAEYITQHCDFLQ
ncbi:MAG: GntR family transcriptional regulator [Proteobacteria bacterium]|nr:GntR family transcriptional regulator [Pseudomonadota bacterium]